LPPQSLQKPEEHHVTFKPPSRYQAETTYTKITRRKIMAEMHNMTEEEVKKMQECFIDNIKSENKEVVFKPFTMSDKERQKILEENIASLELQVSELTDYIKSVFDGHVLIDGQFRKITIVKSQ